MITLYYENENSIHACDFTFENTALLNENMALLKRTLWIDLVAPTVAEEKLIENYLTIDIPSKQEMEEIELSSRLYMEDDALFMTTSLIAFSNTPHPKMEVVTFILANKQLITVRYAEHNAFKVYINRLLKSRRPKISAPALLCNLLDAITERLADILEKISHDLEQTSQRIFQSETPTSPAQHEQINYKSILQSIGGQGDLGAKARESIISFIRLLSYLEQADLESLTQSLHLRLNMLKNDLHALSDYTAFISAKINFILDATLGLINIEQNNIIKIFSIAAVIFLPPTLIASLYGMNFRLMPELDWTFGYPFAIGVMILSAILPFSYFKIKKWI